MAHEKSSKDCPICERPKTHSKKHDAYYCEHCNIWLEPICYNRNCEFCANRPKNPVKDIYADVLQRIKIQDRMDVCQGVIVNKQVIKDPRKNKKD